MITLRAARAADAPALVRIYAPYVLGTTVSYEYEVPAEGAFRSRMVKIMERYPYLVAEENGMILGYAYASPYASRAAYSWSAELSVYVDESCRGRGIGTLFYEKLIDLLGQMHMVNLYAIIDYPNESSMALHKRFGFVKTALLKDVGFKHGKWCSTVILEKRLDSPENPKPLVTDWRSLL